MNKISELREMWARELWVTQELRKRVSEDVYQDIIIQAEVLEMDPEFSFYKTMSATAEVEPEPVPELFCGAKHQSK